MNSVGVVAAAFWLLAGAAAAQDMLCIPPEEPFIPADDADFSEYADLVAEDFERYFAELTPYFRCLDATREAAFARAREISDLRDEFWARADAMGLTEEAAPDMPEGGAPE